MKEMCVDEVDGCRWSISVDEWHVCGCRWVWVKEMNVYELDDFEEIYWYEEKENVRTFI